MTENKIILDQPVSEETWQWFFAQMEACERSTGEVAQDGVLDRIDIVTLLNIVPDQALKFSDFHQMVTQFGWEKFMQMKSFLEVHHFNVYLEARDGYRVLNKLSGDELNFLLRDDGLDYTMFFQDKEFCRWALERSPKLFASIPETYQAELALGELKRNAKSNYGPFLDYIPTDFLNNTDFLTEWLLDYPYEHLMIGIPVEAVTEKNKISAEKLPEIISVMVLRNHQMMRFPFSSVDYDIVWQKTIQKMKLLGYNFPDDMLVSYVGFRKGLERITSNPERFHAMSTLWTLWQNAHDMDFANDPRPIAVLCYAAADWNQAFESYPLADQMVHSGKFHVIYAEVTTDEQVLNILETVSCHGARPIHTLVLAGHGTQTTLALSGADLGVSNDGPQNEDSYVSTSDLRRRSKFSELGDFIDPQGQLLLYSCSNGAGGKKGQNLANAFAKKLPPTASVTSVRFPANIDKIYIDEDLFIRIEWAAYNPEGTYYTPGSLDSHSTKK